MPCSVMLIQLILLKILSYGWISVEKKRNVTSTFSSHCYIGHCHLVGRNVTVSDLNPLVGQKITIELFCWLVQINSKFTCWYIVRLEVYDVPMKVDDDRIRCPVGAGWRWRGLFLGSWSCSAHASANPTQPSLTLMRHQFLLLLSLDKHLRRILMEIPSIANCYFLCTPVANGNSVIVLISRNTC